MTNAQLSYRRRLARNRARNRARRARFMAAGFRCDGRPRQYRRHDDLAHLHGIARKRAIGRKHYAENTARGLTCKGDRVRTLRKWPQLRGLKGRAYRNAMNKILAREHRAAGFTLNGRPLKRFSGPIPARTLREISYDFFRKSLGDCRAPELLTRLERDAA